ncbi:MAG: hypothetical protein LWX55_14645 [Deltaproteobacteria bacterium]|nr:hypothetical protein [Deltaproteobacteria bacterium]
MATSPDYSQDRRLLFLKGSASRCAFVPCAAQTDSCGKRIPDVPCGQPSRILHRTLLLH